MPAVSGRGGSDTSNCGGAELIAVEVAEEAPKVGETGSTIVF